MSIEAMNMALEALELFVKYENPNARIQVRKPKDGGPMVTIYPKRVAYEAATALRQAIEKAEQAQPVAHSLMCVCGAVWDIKPDGGEEMVHTPDVTPPRKPVAWRWKERINGDFDSWVVTSSEPPPYAIEQQPLYTTPLQRKPLTEREIELIDGMIEVQLRHADQCDRIANRTMAEKQKAWDMERVELLCKLKAAHGIGENT